MKSKTAIKKARVEKQINDLDPNNNKNIPGKPLVKKRNKKVPDDGFEHRTSSETV